MNALARVSSMLGEGRELHQLEKDIHTIRPFTQGLAHYDVWARTAFYDTVVASRLYNRLVWGTSPADYAAFEALAVRSRPTGWMLDAGCGSLVFTTRVFAPASDRPVVLMDHSLRMLRRARARLERACGRVPEHLVLLLGDILDLPFRDGQFSTVSLPGVIHAFPDPAVPVRHLHRVLAPDGSLFLTSLVLAPGRALANRYLREMHRGGEIARPRSTSELAQHLAAATGPNRWTHTTQGNMSYFRTDAR